MGFAARVAGLSEGAAGASVCATAIELSPPAPRTRHAAISHAKREDKIMIMAFSEGGTLDNSCPEEHRIPEFIPYQVRLRFSESSRSSMVRDNISPFTFCGVALLHHRPILLSPPGRGTRVTSAPARLSRRLERRCSPRTAAHRWPIPRCNRSSGSGGTSQCRSFPASPCRSRWRPGWSV